jgi:hypothetical protein
MDFDIKNIDYHVLLKFLTLLLIGYLAGLITAKGGVC